MVRTFQLTKSLSRLSVHREHEARRHRAARREAAQQPPGVRSGEAQEKAIEARGDELLSRFRLDHVRDEFAGELSGGQRKLLEMAGR